MRKFCHRQMHFDFHTSGYIEDIGKEFDPDLFKRKLIESKVQSVNIFAKCHHSWSYYPTEVGQMHPHLNFDLCGEMYRAAKSANAECVIYLPVGWSEGDADEHPEWCARRPDGSLWMAAAPYEPGDGESFKPFYQWKHLCINGGYADHVCATVEEILEHFPDLDGLFLDIMYRNDCYCPKCRADMAAEGVDAEDPAAAHAFYDRKWRAFSERVKALLFAKHPDAKIFFNGGADMNNPQWHKIHTHIEMEDLPTVWGGYDKMPVSAQYFSRVSDYYLGMTAKFHKAWGEFGGYKNPDALRYEIAAMMAYGAGCCIGEQLHPTCMLDNQTFVHVKYAYDYAESIEEYCYDFSETSRLGAMLSFDPSTDEGLSKMLLENQLDFRIVLPGEELTGLDALIVPEGVTFDESEAAILNAFAGRGGKLLVSGNGGTDRGQTRFLLNVGAVFEGKSEYSEDFVEMRSDAGIEWCQSPVLFYESAYRVRPEGRVLADILTPYFKRTYRCFCGHMTVPYRPGTPAYPAAIRTENTVYLAHGIFGLYIRHGAQFHRDFFKAMLDQIYDRPVLKVNLMSSGRAKLTEQPQKNRYILHVLYASSTMRGGCLVLEDFPEIENTAVEIRTERKISRVVLRPQGRELEFCTDGGVLRFEIPSFRMHQIAEIDYEGES